MNAISHSPRLVPTLMLSLGAARTGRRTARPHARPAAPSCNHGGWHEAATMMEQHGLPPGEYVSRSGFSKAFYSMAGIVAKRPRLAPGEDANLWDFAKAIYPQIVSGGMIPWMQDPVRISGYEHEIIRETARANNPRIQEWEITENIIAPIRDNYIRQRYSYFAHIFKVSLPWSLRKRLKFGGYALRATDQTGKETIISMRLLATLDLDLQASQLIGGGYTYTQATVRRLATASASVVVGLAAGAGESQPRSNQPTRKMPRARSGHAATDAALVEQMHELIVAGTARGRWNAAGILAAEAAGTGGYDAKRRRLSNAYARRFGDKVSTSRSD